MSLTHIETIELTSSQASITFSSIPQDYDDLVLKISARSDRAQVADVAGIQFNGETSTANYSGIFLTGDGSSITTSNQANWGGHINGNNTTGNTFGNSDIYISNYTANQNKSFGGDAVTENNASGVSLDISASLWSNTDAITSIVIFPKFSTNLLAGSTFSLYGVTAG